MSADKAKPKIAARLIRALFIGNLIGLLLFVIFYLGGTLLNTFAGQTIVPPWAWGTFGWLAGISASIGIELSKDLET